MNESTVILDRAVVDAVVSRHREPAWLAERRLESLRFFQQAPYPRWERTDLAPVDVEGLLRRARPLFERGIDACDGGGRVADGVATARVGDAGELPLPDALRSSLAEGPDGSTLLVQVATRQGGLMWGTRIDPELARQGVVIAPLHEALASHEELVRRHFMTRALPPSSGKFSALCGALWDVATLVYVPRGVRVDRPVEVITWAQGDRAAVFPRTLVVLDEEAELRLVESWGSSPAEGRTLVSGAVEIVAGPASRLEYAPLQRWDTSVTAFVQHRAVLDRDSQVEWAVGEFGAGLTRAEFETLLEGQGSASHLVMVFFGGGAQHLDFVTSMEHRGTHTDSDIVARGVLSGRARGIYGAITHIQSGARESGSWQKGNILVLSPDARADANPSVVVQESEVQRAGHAATVGRVDPEQLFYLMSRGLPEPVAIRLIVEGFLQPVLEKIPIDAVREQIRTLVEARLQEA